MKAHVGFVFLLVCANGGLRADNPPPDHSQYRGHQIHRVTPTKNSHVRWLRAIEERNVLNADFWTSPRSVGVPVDIRLSPEHREPFLTALEDQKIPYKTTIHDLESSILQHLNAQRQAKKVRKPGQPIWDDYLEYQEILDWIDMSGDDCGPERCVVSSIGSTYGGRDMKLIKITNGDGATKTGFWVDAGIHAREWIAPATATYFIDRLINDYGSDVSVTSMLDNYDFYILALMNADGYEYSHTDDRLWRKSRRPNEGSVCVGTDINRNFDHQWGTVGVSFNPCSETYCGSRAYSEIEAENVANYIHQNNGTNWQVFYTLHSYGQLWMAPWGYTTDPPVNYDKLMCAGQFAVDALAGLYGTEYTLGSASEILYQSSGTSRDWAKGVAEIEYVYTIELRDDGDSGFLLPPDQIRPTVEETWEGIKAFTLSIIEERCPDTSF